MVGRDEVGRGLASPEEAEGDVSELDYRMVRKYKNSRHIGSYRKVGCLEFDHNGVRVSSV